MKYPSTMIVAVSLLGALALPAGAQPASGSTGSGNDGIVKKTSPGHATLSRTHKVVATVEAVDAAKRAVTLKGPDGKSIPLTVGPEVRNLEQVKVGDHVVVGYHEALSLKLMKGGKALPSATTTSDAVRAPTGERPAGIVAEETTVTADVIAVNTKTHMVTLRGPKQEVDLYVADPEQLKLIKVGDQVDAVYTQAMAVSVEPAPAGKTKKK